VPLLPYRQSGFRNNDILPGETNPSYTIDSVSADDEADYHCEVSNNLAVAISDPAALTVLLDTIAPTLSGAVVQSPNQVDILFSETVTQVSAEAIANYQIDQGVQVSSATLHADNRTVSLQIDSLEPGLLYTVTINDILDASSNANAILPDSNISIMFEPTINFDNGSLPFGWVPLTQSRWSIFSDSGNNVLFLNTTSYSPLPGLRLGEYILAPDSYTDFSLKVDVKTNESPSNSNADYALVFGYQDENNYYYMLFNSAFNNAKLSKVVGGVREDIANTTEESWFFDGNYHTAEVSRVADTIEVRFNGAVILQAIDSAFASGKLGLGSFNDSAYFDNIRITAGSGATNDLVFADEFE